MGTTIVNALITLKDNLLEAFTALGSLLSDVFGGVGEAIISALSTLGDFLGTALTALGDFILAGIKSLFLPEDGFIDEKVNELKEKFIDAFGLDGYDMSFMFSKETAANNVKVTILGHNVTIVDMSFIKDALNTFRPIIRGLITLLLVFYNINQFLAMIGHAPITMGSIVASMKNDGGETVDN